MTALAMALALASAQPLGPWAPSPRSGWTPSWNGGRIYSSASLHIGVRPAAFVDDEGAPRRLELGAGVTVQVTF